MRTRFFLALIALAIPTITFAQLEPEKSLASLTVSEKLQVELFAAEPLFTNPTSFDIDHLGRVWVCEAVNYRRKLRNQQPLRNEGDRIVILTDTTGDGKADKAETFWQHPDLMAPLGIAVAKEAVGPGYKVFVCQSPDLLLFTDKDGDGKADGPPIKLLTGFRGIDHDHGIHGVLIGPDGKLYFTVGDSGLQGLKDKDGKIWTSNNTDCRAGTVWRCDQDGSNLELIAHNFRNNYEPAVDSFGTIFLSDNDDDGLQQTRICYVMPGGNYGYHPRGPGQTHWHEEQPGIVHKILRTYFGSPTGMCVYEGSLLPEKYRGQLLHTDAGPRHLRCYHLTADGAGYTVDREDMIQSTDNWFRPSDVCVAPDGSVFIADWYDPGVGGHGMGDTTRGRIFRVTPKGHKGYQVPKLDLSQPAGIRAALASPNLAMRAVAMDRLKGMKYAEAEAVLRPAIEQTENPFLRARAVWQLYGRTDPEVQPLKVAAELAQLIQGGDSRLALLALRLMNDRGVSPTAMDLSRVDFFRKFPAAIRREALLLSRHADPEKVKPLVLALAPTYDGKDRFLLNALGIAVGTDPKRREVILADFDKQFPKWSPEVADLVFELRPPVMMPKLETLLADAGTPADQRGRIVDILASGDDPAAGQALLRLLPTDLPAEVRGRVLENLKQFLPGKWQSLRGGPELSKAIDALLLQTDGTESALALIAAGGKIDAVPLVRKVAADPKSPPQVKAAALRTLGQLPSAEAVEALSGFVNAEGIGAEAINALGAQVQANRAGAKPALVELQRLIQDDKAAASLRLTAVGALAGSQAGTAWLIDSHEKKQLAADLVADTGKLLRNSPYQGLRNRAMLAFPAPGKLDPKKLPPIAELAKRTGNVENGKKLMLASLKGEAQCMKCHGVRGQGGQIGPDLSMIGKKASKENLYESILIPSKAIADQYITWQIETSAGQVVSGLLVEETPQGLTLRDANGKDTKIDKADIEGRSKSLVSLMPENLIANMTEAELVDLVEYLFSLKTPALTLDAWQLFGPFPNGVGDAGLDKDYGPEKEIDLKATASGKTGPVKWRTIRPDATGYVDLAAAHGRDANDSVSYVTRGFESPEDQEATVLLGTDDAAKLWVNGEAVLTTRAHRAASPEQDAVKVKLKKGANTVLLKVANGDGPHGFYLTVISEQELKTVPIKE